jgi:aldehyde dehydrogenase (NAD+)
MTLNHTRDRLYIDGAWVPSTGSGTLPVTNPFTEQVIGTVPDGTAEDVDAAARAAARALPGWSETSLDDRVKACRAIAEGLKARAQEVALYASTEMGAPWQIAVMVQAGLPVIDFASMEDVADQVEWERRSGNSLLVRKPVGVVGAITPWNYPLHQISAKVAPTLLAGGTIVVKPSELVPGVAYVLAEVIHDAGPAAGRVQPRHRHGPGRRRGDREARGRRHGVVHRLDPRRAPGGRAGVGGAQAHVAGARRQERLGAARRPVGRGAGQRHRRLADRVPDQQRPDVQRHHPAARAARPARRGRGAARGVRAVRADGRPDGPRDAAGPAGQQAPAGERPRLHPGRGRRRREADRRRAGAAGGPADRLLRQADRDRRRGRLDHRAGGGLRAGAHGRALRRRRGGRAADRQRHRLRAVRRGLGLDKDRAVAFAKRMRTGQVGVNGGVFNPTAPFGGFGQSGYGRELGPLGVEEFTAITSLQL